MARLARVADLPLSAERRDLQVELLGGFLAFSDAWADLGLAFSFADGTFDYAQSVAQFRPDWDRPTGLNKGRVVAIEPDGSVAQRSPDGR